MKQNLEHSALPDPKEIRDYQEGKLDPARAHEIELIAQENPLLAEAIEGYSANPAYHMLPGITAAVTTAAGVGVASGLTAGVTAVAKAATPWWHLNGWLIGVAAGTSAAVGTYYVAVQNNEEKFAAKSTELRQEDAYNKENTEQGTLLYDSLMMHADEGLQHEENPVAEDALKNTTEAAVSQQNTYDGITLTSDSDEFEKRSDPGSLARIDSRNFPKEIDGPEDDKNQAPKSSSTVAIQIMKVLNYKMADYTAIRNASWEKFNPDDVGLPARWASEEEREQYSKDHPGMFVPYVDYISTCISAFDKAKYDTSIERFAVVLEQYPDDVNALFYSALSHYHLQEFDDAIAFFQKVEKNAIRTFNEESFFYHARCWKAKGDIDGANSFFVKVVRLNGFYKERAIEEMQ
jgi:tetratricopeptide (TPR) repeat protein